MMGAKSPTTSLGGGVVTTWPTASPPTPVALLFRVRNDGAGEAPEPGRLVTRPRGRRLEGPRPEALLIVRRTSATRLTDKVTTIISAQHERARDVLESDVFNDQPSMRESALVVEPTEGAAQHGE